MLEDAHTLKAVLVYAAIAIGVPLLLYILLSRRKETVATTPDGTPPFRSSFFTPRHKKALYAFAATRGLSVLPEDTDGVLAGRFTEMMNLPVQGKMEDILKFPLSQGEGYLYTQRPDVSASDTDSEVTSHNFLVVFVPLSLSGRTFLTPKFPLGGSVGRKMIEMVLSHIFGVKDLTFLEVDREFPEFAKGTNIFTEDEAGARNLILNTEVTSLIMERPEKLMFNMAVTPGGMAMRIEPLMKKPEQIEQLISWSEKIARALSER
jgi:hypothetical protein